MDSDSWGQIILLLVLIIGSAFFSASETAFTSLNKIRLKTMADDGNKKAARTLKIAEEYDKFLSSVLIGNNIVNIASTSITTVLFIAWLGNNPTSTTVSTVVMTVVVLIFGEVTPKSIAKEMPEKFAMFATPFLSFVMVVFTPFVAFFSAWKKMLKKVFNLQNDDAITGDELLNIVEEAHSGGGIDETESDLIRSAISFSEHPVSDILTPRVDIVAISKDEELSEISKVFDESGFSRLPVFDETIDSIVGVIHIRDFNKLVLTQNKTLESIIKEPVFVAKQISISNLLKFMQEKKTHMAVVADEYGGTLGIATMEDILEELVGEIWDEYDEVVEEFIEIEDGTVQVLCSAQLDKLFEYFDMDEDEESESVSVGGWVLEKLGKIAEEGDTFEYENLKVTVTKVDDCRVLEINISIKEIEPLEETIEEEK